MADETVGNAPFNAALSSLERLHILRGSSSAARLDSSVQGMNAWRDLLDAQLSEVAAMVGVSSLDLKRQEGFHVALGQISITHGKDGRCNPLSNLQPSSSCPHRIQYKRELNRYEMFINGLLLKSKLLMPESERAELAFQKD